VASNPFVRFLAKRYDSVRLRIFVMIDIDALNCIQFPNFFELLGPDENLFLRHFDNRPVKVLKEQSVLLEHAFVNLQDLEEVDIARDAELVFDCTLLRDESEILLLSASDNPLQILHGHLVIHWDEESLVVA